MSTQPENNDLLLSRLFQPTLRVVPKAVSALLAAYSSIEVESQKAHITRFRNEAYEKYPYPCLGRWRFLDLDLSIHPLYQSEILPPLTSKGVETDAADWVFLDLGCCLGQDIRKLIFDGADSSRVYGADLRPEFIEVGYSFFGDTEKFPPSHFVAPADVFDFSPSSALSRLDGKVGILHTCAVFHLFDLDEQKKMAQRVLKLLNPARKRVLVVGGQVGSIHPGEVARRRGSGTRYRHDADTWRKFWEDVVSEQEWKDKIQGVTVESLLEERISGLGENLGGETGDKLIDSNTTQRQIGLFEEGFRWHTWSVWIDFI